MPPDGMPPDGVPENGTTEQATLTRVIGPGTLAANFANATIGAGIFTIPAILAAQLGDATAVAYAVCILLVMVVFLCYAEAGSRVHASGGAYAYIETAFGPMFGFMAANLLWFGFGVCVDAALSDVLMSTVATMVPALALPIPRAIGLILLFVLIGAVNVVGTKSGARLSVWLTVLKLSPLVLLLLVGLPHVDLGRLVPAQMPDFRTLGSGVLLLMFAFMGGEQSLTASGEIKNPSRSVPLGLLGGLSTVVVLYFGLQLVSEGVLGPDLPRQTAAPLAATAERLLGPSGRLLIVVTAALSIFATISGDVLNAPRGLYAAAKDGLLPAVLARVHPRFRTPYVAIGVYSTMACLLALFGAFKPLAILGTSSILMVDIGVCLAVLRLRQRKVREDSAPFVVPGGPLIPVVAVVVAVGVLSNLSRDELLGLSAVVFFSGGLYLRMTRAKLLAARRR